MPDLQDHFFVVHQQNGFLAGTDIARRGLCLLSAFFRGGKINIEGRAVSFFTVNRDLAGVIAQNAENRGQAQTGAAAHLAGREKRLKNTVAGGGIHAAARVRHRHFHIIARRQVRGTGILGRKRNIGGLEIQIAAGRHGLPGVDIEIQQDLFDLARVDFHGTEVRGESGLNANFLVGSSEHPG